MAKPRNTVESYTLTLTTTPQVRSYLSELVKGGLHGKNVAEAAERLLARGIDELIERGSLKRLTEAKEE